jgi:predicted amino acid-binding ACT domain protein
MDVVGADRTKIVTDVMRVFATHGIEFAYPTQTTFTAAPDGTMIMPYPQVQPVVALEKGEETRREKRA